MHMRKGLLGIPEVELVIQLSPGLFSGSSIAHHAYDLLCLGQVSPRDHRGGWWLMPTYRKKENTVKFILIGLINDSLLKELWTHFEL